MNSLQHFRGSSLYSWSWESISLDIDRDNVLGSAMHQMGKTLGHALRNRSLHVTFKNEPGRLRNVKPHRYNALRITESVRITEESVFSEFYIRENV